MDSRHAGLGDDGGWNDPMFHTSQFDDLTSDSPFNDFINADHSFGDHGFGDSPGLTLRTPSKSAGHPDAAAAAAAAAVGGAPAPAPVRQPTGASAESSSQDSASDSSSRRKRKVSDSPISDQMTETGVKDDAVMDMGAGPGADVKSLPPRYPTRPMHDLSLEREPGMWDFGAATAPTTATTTTNNSAASSPIPPGEFDHAMSLNAQVRLPASTVTSQFHQSPVQTINPGMFQVGASREESPMMTNMFSSHASPQAIFSSTSSSDSPEAFAASQWNPSVAANPSWPPDFTPQYTPPAALGVSPSSVMNGAASSRTSRGSTMVGRSPLHIASISTKSRVETQINVIMTLEAPPPGIEHLHLPLHTIAKSKLLAKEDIDPSRTLELHTMLVCSSAMHNPQLQRKALDRAAAQSNAAVQQRAEQIRDAAAKAPTEEEKNALLDPMKSVPEDDRPANGGEVRICANCIQRERKRAGRKKLKREEEQQHWERFETERVVVFNSNEYLSFKPPEQNLREAGAAAAALPDGDGPYVPPDGALQVTAAMRIACYCRHQSEKEGFRVIFTMKDQQGNVVAQQMSDSILITDDHKTHPPSYTTMPTESFTGAFAAPSATYGPNGLPMSHSMLDLQQTAAAQGIQPFTSSRSTGNLQALAYGQQQLNPNSHIHQLSNPGYTSQATSATMTPTNLSRPASPTGAGQAGPNKKRKSGSFHRRVPSGLTMTPRVDTGQAGAAMPPAVSSSALTSPFSPPGEGLAAAPQQSYMTIPANNGPASYYVGSGPPTPSETQQPFAFSQAQIEQHLMRDRNAAAYFSHPSSAVPSRASSPVLQQSRPNMTAYARQSQAIQTPTGGLLGRQQQQQQQHQQPPPPPPPPPPQPQQQPQVPQVPQGMFQQQAVAASDSDNSAPPTITKITPSEGPVNGGTEVSIYGYNFPEGTRVMFGDKLATTVFYGPQALLATSPPSRPGGVNVTLVPPGQPGNQYTSPPANRHIFTYTDKDPRMMELALKYLSQQQSGNPMGWNQMATRLASQYVSSSIGRAGLGNQGGGAMMAAGGPADVEEMLVGMVESAGTAENADAILSSACASGMTRLAAALLARGANPDARDEGGYTPLMHAAVQGHLGTLRLLITKGADPSLRSLLGYTAFDLVARGSRGELETLALETPRGYSSRRPSLHTPVSSDSGTRSWDISSASSYESEPDSTPSSRRLSAIPSMPLTAEEAAETGAAPPSPGVSPLAAMIAWRDALSAQIQHFQQSVSHLSLPARPPAPHLQDCQDNAVVRRLSALVHATGAAAAPPPAYNDLFPDQPGPEERDQPAAKRAVTAAVVDAMADVKCTVMFEECPSASLSSRSPEGRSSAGCPPNTTTVTGSAAPWLWVSELPDASYVPGQMTGPVC